MSAPVIPAILLALRTATASVSAPLPPPVQQPPQPALHSVAASKAELQRALTFTRTQLDQCRERELATAAAEPPGMVAWLGGAAAGIALFAGALYAVQHLPGGP